MEEASGPVFNEASIAPSRRAAEFLLPIPSRVRMAVEGKEESARGAGVSPFDPLKCPPMTGQKHPRLGAFQACLDIGHISIRSLPGVTGQKGIDVSCLSSLHGGKCAGEF